MRDKRSLREERNFRQPKEIYSRLLGRLPILLFELCADGTTLFASDELLQMTDFSPEELAGENWWNVLCPLEFSRHATRLVEELEQGDVAGRELRILTRSRSIVVLEIHTANEYDSQGKLKRICAAAFDVTPRRRAEEDLARLRTSIEARMTARNGHLQQAVEQSRAEVQSRQNPLESLSRTASERDLLAELEATISAIADAVVVYGKQGEILRMNPAAEALFPYSLEDRRRPYAERAHLLRKETIDGRRFPVEEGLIVPVLQEGKTLQGLLMALHTPGELRYVSVSAAPMRVRGGILGAVVTFTDITGVQQLRRQHEIYLQTISHDLRIPLTVIQGHAELLQETCREEETGPAAHLEAIVQAGERMNRMIEDLVEAARLEGGILTLQQEKLDLREHLQGILDRSFMEAEAKRIHLIAAELPLVQADPDRLERIVINLLSNALKYSPPGSPVRVEAAAAGGEIVLTVADQGEGIAEEDLPHIFERFYRTRNHRRPDSVGLGLFITRMLVQAHGGRIWVESSAGGGSTFFFTLPIA